MSKSNVLFGGVDLGDASLAFQVIDVQISAPERTASVLNPPAADGQIFGSIKNGVRGITVWFDILTNDPAARLHGLRSLAGIVAGRSVRALRVPGMPDAYLNAVCTALPDVSELDWAETLGVQFTAFDPYIYSDIDDLDMPLAAGGSVNFPIGCSGSVRPTITQEIASALTDPTWTCSNGQTIMLQGSVAAGTLVIDCEARQITHSADDAIMTKLSLDSLFFDFAPNPATNFTPYAMTCANGAAGQMRGRYRWL